VEGFTDRDIDRVIGMAWEDRTPFSAIHYQFGLAERDVITLMRRELKASSCSRQKHISFNKISKR